MTSGYLNNPVRTILIDRDNRPGTYPTQTSPQESASNDHFEGTKPFRDTVAPSTPVVYGRSEVSVTRMPRDGDSLAIFDGTGTPYRMTFKKRGTSGLLTKGASGDATGGFSISNYYIGANDGSVQGTAGGFSGAIMLRYNYHKPSASINPISKDGGTTGWITVVGPSGRFNFRIRDAAGSSDVIMDAGFVPGNTYCAAWSWDGTNLRCAVVGSNGHVEVKTVSPAFGYTPGTAQLYIGRNFGGAGVTDNCDIMGAMWSDTKLNTESELIDICDECLEAGSMVAYSGVTSLWQAPNLETDTIGPNNLTENGSPTDSINSYSNVSYGVGLRGVESSRASDIFSFTASDVTKSGVASRLISAINQATGGRVTASPGENPGDVNLIQSIPGTVGNKPVTQVSKPSRRPLSSEYFSGGNSGEVLYPYGIYTTIKLPARGPFSSINYFDRDGNPTPVLLGGANFSGAVMFRFNSQNASGVWSQPFIHISFGGGWQTNVVDDQIFFRIRQNFSTDSDLYTPPGSLKPGITYVFAWSWDGTNQRIALKGNDGSSISSTVVPGITMTPPSFSEPGLGAFPGGFQPCNNLYIVGALWGDTTSKSESELLDICADALQAGTVAPYAGATNMWRAPDLKTDLIGSVDFVEQGTVPELLTDVFGTAGTRELVDRVVKGDRIGDLYVPTSGKATLLDSPSGGHPWCDCTPFNEANAEQAFGLRAGSGEYGTQVDLSDDFFTRGSVSGSLDEPLSAKDKIVIDLTPVETTRFGIERINENPGDDANFSMVYFNHVNRVWEPIGFGLTHNSPTILLSSDPTGSALDAHYIGFGQGYENIAYAASSSVGGRTAQSQAGFPPLVGEDYIFAETSWCPQVDTFGFPLHPKYHATGSQCLSVASLVDRPFLVEKMVYEFSGSSGKHPTLPSTFENTFKRTFFKDGAEFMGLGGTFFILNQRKANPAGQEEVNNVVYISAENGDNPASVPYNSPFENSGTSKTYTYTGGSIPQLRQLSPGGPSVYVDTVRDVVSFCRIGSVWPEYTRDVVEGAVSDRKLNDGLKHPASFMDLAIEFPSGSSFSGKFTVAKSISVGGYSGGTSIYELVPFGADGYSPAVYMSKDSHTRNGLNIPSGRSKVNEFLGSQLQYKSVIYSGADFGGDYFVYTYGYDSDTSTSPYIIFPGDQLVFGWQSLISYGVGRRAPFLEIASGAGKLTLYGSYLRDDKPVHDIFKEPLNTDALHEALPAGPWVLDRFESEPTMVYSGSMREEYVTGSMVTLTDGSLTVTNVNDLSLGGVRAVSARVSDGNVRQRWSFNRNVRLVDSEEQYYDSMQPNPINWLLAPNNVQPVKIYYDTGFGGNYAINIMLMYPGESVNEYWNQGTGGGNTLTGSNIDAYANKEFLGSFPFEGRYRGIDRVKKINSNILNKALPVFDIESQTFNNEVFGGGTFDGLKYWTHVKGDSGGNSGKTSMILAKGGIAKNKDFISDDWTGFWAAFDSYYWQHSPVGVNEDTVFSPAGNNRNVFSKLHDTSERINYAFSNFMGTFGEGPKGLHQYRRHFGAINIDQTTRTGRPVSGQVITVDGQEIFYRGTKYGLVNPTPLFSNATFSGTSFGQPRDMLESRQYTRFSLGDSTLTDAAVEVVFIDRSILPDINGSITNNITSGSATNSTNISPFCTSSHPYDDALADLGQIWDRFDPLPETLIRL